MLAHLLPALVQESQQQPLVPRRLPVPHPTSAQKLPRNR
jgi:hypothetical protein